MTTDTQKAHLGVAALYARFSDQPYWPRTHWSRRDSFVADPLYTAPAVVFDLEQDLVKVNHEYVPDPVLNTRIK
jgi:hypothetical protein